MSGRNPGRAGEQERYLMTAENKQFANGVIVGVSVTLGIILILLRLF
ncbi:MAG: hypothetical protein KOO63_07830 [Bacteroidales bacterium]|nr:hypothetical protein [Candidatus Latescibacterota bacterium]